MNDYKLMAPGAFVISGILTGGATLLENYAQVGVLVVAAVFLGGGVWALLSAYEQISNARINVVNDILKQHSLLHDDFGNLSNKADKIGKDFNDRFDSLKENSDNISAFIMSINNNISNLSQEMNSVNDGFNVSVERLQNTINDLDKINGRLDDMVDKINTGFTTMQTEFGSSIDHMDNIHKTFGENVKTLCSTLKSDFSSIRTEMEHMCNKQEETFKNVLNQYAEDTLDEIDFNHKKMMEVIDVLKEGNDNNIDNIKLNIDTMTRTLERLLRNHLEDMKTEYNNTCALMETQPQLLKDMKNELTKLLKKQQDINKDDLELMERILNGK